MEFTGEWWRREIIYQVYPRSFQDTNNDGIGDLKGVRSRLPYLKELGVGVVWLSPIFLSPMADFGYDISDYTAIDPRFGTLQDFDDLLKEAHDLGFKLILDLVPNHTSDQHQWFKESRSSRDNPKRDWYIWKDAKPDGSLPNNWLSVFGGPGWEWDANTGQYYYHAFLKEQPDLNWRNPEVQRAMFNVMRFWLERGVDGFRVDVMWHMIKDDMLRDNPVNPDYLPHMATYDSYLPVYSTDQPEVHSVVRKMRDVIDEFPDRMMIGEIYLPISKLVAYYGADNKGAHLPFNFQLLTLPWDPRKISSVIVEYEAALPSNGWPNWVLGNHDQPRIASRVGLQQARVAALMLLTLRGTPTLYYGDEIGMQDVPIPPGKIVDPQGLNMPDKNLTRDPARTPMPWSNKLNGGFSDVEPWLPLDKNFPRLNVESQRGDSDSMFEMYKKLIALRQSSPSLIYGHFRMLYSDHQLISYLREAPGHPAFLIVLNLSHRTTLFRSPVQTKGIVELDTYMDLIGTEVSNIMALRGDEGLLIRLTK
jgi:alpha-glucosidase